jgi:hypothetical protein
MGNPPEAWIILGLAIAGILTIGVYGQIAATYKWWPFKKK